MTQENEIPKYLKQKESNISKSNRKFTKRSMLI